METTTITKIRRLQSDIQSVAKAGAACAADPVSLKSYLSDELIPLMATMGEMFEVLEDDNSERDEAIADLIDQEGDIINPELSAMIIHALQLGNQICDMLAEGVNDDLTAKKLGNVMREYRQASFDAAKEVLSVTAEPDDDGDFEDTPVEIPKKKNIPEGDDDADGNDAQEDDAKDEEETAAEG